jgi:hypothetical protein
MGTRNENVCWALFRKMLSESLGEEFTENDGVVYGHWFRFLKEAGPDKVKSLALALDPDDCETWLPLGEVIFEWCLEQVIEQIHEENVRAGNTATGYKVGPDGKLRRVVHVVRPPKLWREIANEPDEE